MAKSLLKLFLLLNHKCVKWISLEVCILKFKCVCVWGAYLKRLMHQYSASRNYN